MALRSDNVPVFVFRTLFQSQTQSALHFARCTTAACTQTERRILQSAAGTNVFHWPSLAVAPGAHPILAYTHSNNFQLAICGSANCDPVTVRTLYSWSNSAQARGSGLSMAILANSQPVLAHYSRSDGVLVTTCTNPSCTAFTHVQIAADGDNLPALQLRSDIYVGQCTHYVRLRRHTALERATKSSSCWRWGLGVVRRVMYSAQH